MRKLILIMLAIITLLPTVAFAKEREVFIKNKFDVEISKEEYKILKDLGYPDESINNITQTYFEYILENKDTLIIQSIKRDNPVSPYSISPYSSDDYPRVGIYQAFHTWGGREQITSVNYSTHNGNNVYEVVNYVSWLQLPRVRSVDLNMITFDDFYVTPIRDTLDGEQAVAYTTCPNGHREPNTIVYYNPYGSRVIYGAETVGFGMNLVNDYEGQGKCVNGLASMIKVKFDNTRSDVRSFDVTGSYLHVTTGLSTADIATAIGKAAITGRVSKGVIKVAKEIINFKYDDGNRTGILVENARW